MRPLPSSLRADADPLRVRCESSGSSFASSGGPSAPALDSHLLLTCLEAIVDPGSFWLMTELESLLMLKVEGFGVTTLLRGSLRMPAAPLDARLLCAGDEPWLLWLPWLSVGWRGTPRASLSEDLELLTGERGASALRQALILLLLPFRERMTPWLASAPVRKCMHDIQSAGFYQMKSNRIAAQQLMHELPLT